MNLLGDRPMRKLELSPDDFLDVGFGVAWSSRRLLSFYGYYLPTNYFVSFSLLNKRQDRNNLPIFPFLNKMTSYILMNGNVLMLCFIATLKRHLCAPEMSISFVY